MSDHSLLEMYNPLYDVHLRQYFALPHMQKHLKNVGLLDSSVDVRQEPQQPAAAHQAAGDSELYARHHAMMDMMLRNKDRVLAQLVDLQRKCNAVEKVELYRSIRVGPACFSHVYRMVGGGERFLKISDIQNYPLPQTPTHSHSKLQPNRYLYCRAEQPTWTTGAARTCPVACHGPAPGAAQVATTPAR